MSQIRDDQKDALEIPEEIENWLRLLSDKSKGKTRGRSQLQVSDPSELLQRAARCYAIAGWADDACRMFVQLGDDRRAAAYFEQSGKWDQAGECYRRVADWQSAARCFLACTRADEAAECFIKAGDPIRAAWIYAHQVRRFRKAETVAGNVKTETDADQLAVQLILARCEAGTGQIAKAAKKLRSVIVNLAALPPDMHRRRLHDWCLAVAEKLNRLDFTALIHAAAVSSGMPGANETWEKWAGDVLGDVTGVPDSS